VVPAALSRLAAFVRRHRAALVAAAVIAAALCALYLPFVSNPLVFDDRGYFTGREFAEYASRPFGFRPRFPPAFSIASVHVVFGTVEAHRAVGLALHVGTTLALFWLLLVFGVGTLPAAIAAAFFGLHPVAVYAAGYLAQRATVMATLFAVLSLAFLARAFALERMRYIVAAAALYAVAVLSKEHAIPVAGLAPVVAWVVGRRSRFAVRATLLFLAASAAAAGFVFHEVREMLQAEVLGQAHGAEALQVGASPNGGGGAAEPWLVSAIGQAALFFRYLLLWLVPATSQMSIDVRVDLPAIGSPALATASIACYLAIGALGIYLASRRGRLALAGAGLLWLWMLYLLEFSVVRLQEPFVLYRSYLWAPGIAMAFGALVARVPARVLVVAGFAVGALLAWQAHDRLRTFESGIALWEDAARKLPVGPVAGGSRPLYQLGREYFYGGHADKAAEVVDRCMARYPRDLPCVMARASMLLASEQYQEALPYLGRAIALQPDAGVPRHHLGFALERLGCREQAMAQYELAVRLGYSVAAQRLKSLEKPGSGLVPPTRAGASQRIDCAQALAIAGGGRR